MKPLSVWAPKAKRVAVEVGGKRFPMEAGEGGWWHALLRSPAPGEDYRLVLDGSKPVPDPRSAWQPGGVHGPSRTVDHSIFHWTDKGWSAPELSSAVIYEMHVGTFTPAGTFDAAIEKLDHLLDMGITHLQIMPVNEFPGSRGWGYDGVDLYAVHHAYGEPDGLKRLVDACHRRGLAVLLDVVYNHLGPSGNYLDGFGHYFTRRYSTPWGPALNFDAAGSDEVRGFFFDNAVMWLRDYHFDGLRLDAVHAILDTSAVHFLEELAARVKSLETELGRRLVLIPESDLNDPRLLQPPAAGGYGLHAQWSDDFHHSLHTVLTGERSGYYQDFGSLADLAKVLRSPYVYDGRYSVHRGRRHGRPPAGLSGDRFLGYLQNHDQVGNRAQGDRSSRLLDVERLKIGAALVMTSPYVPLLFQGEEWGASTPFLYFTDHQDPELGRAVSEGRRREFVSFGWDPSQVPDPQAKETFERSKLIWSETAREPHRTLLEWHRELIRLRGRHAALRDGRLDLVSVAYDEEARWLVLGRGPLKIACNLAEAPQRLTVASSTRAPARVLLASSPGVQATPDAVELPAASVAVLE